MRVVECVVAGRRESASGGPCAHLRRYALPFGFGSAALFAASVARAEPLRIETLEERSWSEAVAALQNDRGSEGRVIHVVIREGDGTQLHCGTYRIGLDAASSEAFESKGCDSSTNATALRLVHRSALFDHDDVVPRPRQPRIVVERTQTSEASGGAKSAAESAVDCVATVRPFIRDLENGGRVALVPGRYDLRTKSSDVRVKPIDDGWTFVAPRGSHTTIEYFVTDTRRAEVVLSDRVAMDCAVQTSSGTGSPIEPLSTQPYVPAPETDTPDEGAPEHATTLPSWGGRAITVNLGVGSATMRTSGLKLANSGGAVDAGALGLHDSTGPVFLAAAAYERPGIYSSFGATVGAAPMNHRTLWNFGVTSVVAAALHLGDTTLYLGPNVQIGTYQSSSDTSDTLAYGSKVQLSLGGAAGARFHLRDEKTGRLRTVLGIELIAPVAGPSPWFLTAQVAFGSGS